MPKDTNEPLQAINEALNTFLGENDWRAGSSRLLSNILRMTKSKYGFSGVLMPGPVLRILTYEGIVWDAVANRPFYEEAVRSFDKIGYLEFSNFQNLFGRVITTAARVVANAPASDPRSGGRPEGHPPLNSFLGVPILKEGGVVGMIGVANRPGGYTDEEIELLEAVARTAGVLFETYHRINEKNELEAQLRQSQKMEAIGRLAGGLAHDFNNMLTVMMGYTEVVFEALPPDSTMRTDLEVVRSAQRRAAQLVRQLLAFSRKQVLLPKLVDLNELVAGSEKTLRRVLREDQNLAIDVSGSTCRIHADPGQIERVILELAMNARDALPAGGHLKIRTRQTILEPSLALHRRGLKPGAHAVLEVADDGNGMDDSTRERIFDPFFTTKGLGMSSGLGLSAVYGIIKQSGGHIEVESSPGEGALFRILLPLEPAAGPEHGVAAGAPRVPRGSETVLLVDEEEHVRDYLKRVLTSAGYTVLAAATAQSALELARRSPGRIHLLLSDVMLSGMNGAELARALEPVAPGLRALFMSGYAGDELEELGYQIAGAKLLRKPFERDQLARLVRQILDE